MSAQRPAIAAALLLSCTLTACGGAGSGNALPSSQSEAAVAAESVAAFATSTSYTCPNAMTSSGKLDCTKLPLGDHKYYTNAQKAGYVYSCNALSGSPVVSSAPWLGTTTWNALIKTVVQGSVSWAGAFSSTLGTTERTIADNGLPVKPETSGTFPIAKTDPAYAYDHNPNSIKTHSVSFSLPANPTIARTPTCLGGGTIGYALDGVAIYDAFDAAGYDGGAHEVFDGCHGHPDASDTYHYHGWIQACVSDGGSATQNSGLIGYALDGFGIYGAWYNGKILTSADLDECHGTTSAVMWNGKLTTIYHYVSTYDFPYKLGCYRGTPVRV